MIYTIAILEQCDKWYSIDKNSNARYIVFDKDFYIKLCNHFNTTHIKVAQKKDGVVVGSVDKGSVYMNGNTMYMRLDIIDNNKELYNNGFYHIGIPTTLPNSALTIEQIRTDLYAVKDINSTALPYIYIYVTED